MSGCGAREQATTSPPQQNQAATQFYFDGLDSLTARIAGLDSAISALDGTAAASAAAVLAFTRARTSYKRIEAQAEYYSATAVKPVNGPSLEAEDEDDPRTTIAADGFQGIEEGLFPTVDATRRDSLLAITALLRAQIPRLREYGSRVYMTDATLLEAIRQELVRIQVLTLAGFDSPVAHHGLAEARAAISGLHDLARLVAPGSAHPERVALLQALDRSAYALDRQEWDTFDRLAWYRDQVPQVARALAAFRVATGVAAPNEPRIWRGEAASVFETGAFDPFAPSAGWAGHPNAATIALGRRLFFDPAVSGSGEKSCATCHQPGRAFTDGLKRSAPLSASRGTVLRNAPTLINSGLQTANFYDLRSETLEDQVGRVVRNQDEMHGDLERTAAQQGLTGTEVRQAIAAYVRSLTSLNSRFDQYVRGEDVPFSGEERLGFNLFMGKGLCGTCHFAPLFNGTVPPAYTTTESEVIGVPSAPRTHGATIDPDEGRMRITRRPTHRHAFKTPTLRNVELTAPYMHNGVYATLEEVLDFYNRGGGAGIGGNVPNQTLPFDKLDLTPPEQQAIIAFLRTLTDTTGLTSALSAP